MLNAVKDPVNICRTIEGILRSTQNDKDILPNGNHPCHAECNEASIYSSADSSSRFLPLVGMTEVFNQSFSTSVPERSRRVNFQLSIMNVV